MVATDDVVAEVLAAEDRRYEALLGPDLPTLERLLHDRLSYAHSSGVRDTKAEYLAKIENGYYDYSRSDHPVESLDVLALAVWTKETGEWQLLAYASTPLPRA